MEPTRPLVKLQGVEASSDSVVLQLSGSVQYNVFATSVPPRLVIDLLDTAATAPSKTVEVGGPLLRRIRAAQFSRKPDAVTRVVMDMEKIAAYKVRFQDNRMTVALEQPAPEPRRRMNYTGFITDASGHPLDGRHRLRFLVLKLGGAAEPLWSDTTEVAVNSGVFSVKLGEGTPLPKEAFDLEYRIDVSLAPSAKGERPRFEDGGPMAAVPAKPQPVSAPAAEDEPLPASPEASPAPGAPRPITKAQVLTSIQYWVQLGSFVDAARAMMLVKALESAGSKAGVASGRSKGVQYHMVRAGPFDSRAEAQAAADKLSSQGYPAIVVKR
jgi:hypothetical protein